MGNKGESVIVVSFVFDLPIGLLPFSDFRKILEGLDWQFNLDDVDLPSSTCIKVFEDTNLEKEALQRAVIEIHNVVKKVQGHGLTEFLIKKYFFVAHRAPPSDAFFGENLGGAEIEEEKPARSK